MLALRTPGSESKSGLRSLPPFDSREDSRRCPAAGVEKRSPPPSTGVAGLFDAGPPIREGAEIRSGTGSNLSGSEPPFSATNSMVESRQNESRTPFCVMFEDRRSEIETRVLPSGIVPCPALSLDSRAGRTSLAGDPVSGCGAETRNCE